MNDEIVELNLQNLARLSVEEQGLLLTSEFASEDLKDLIERKFLRFARSPEEIRTECSEKGCSQPSWKKKKCLFLPSLEFCLERCTIMRSVWRE